MTPLKPITGRADFPPGFVFGAATSAYQIEGHGHGGAGPTHWDDFAARPGAVKNRENGALACDHYHRYQQDLEHLRGLDAYRFSTSWARVLPEGTGAVNRRGLDFYDRLVDACLARDLAPHLSLYHWELPAALDARGGWRNRDIAGWFADFAEIVMRRLGDRIDHVATINEPWCVSYLSHFLGHHAPGMRDITATARAMHHVLLAHGAALERLRGLGCKNIGIVLNFEAVDPLTPSPKNKIAANVYDAIINQWFIQGICRGNYPEPALAALAPHLPERWQDDMARIGRPIDWLGVNYYTRQRVAAAPRQPWPSLELARPEGDTTGTGWEIHPAGLRRVLNRLKREHLGDLPIHVTENGMAWDDRVSRGRVHDPQRIDFIRRHLQELLGAINDGVNVQGYFCWSLLDNFEWALGYDKRFGLVHVDFATQKRVEKDSMIWLRNLAAGAPA